MLHHHPTRRLHSLRQSTRLSSTPPFFLPPSLLLLLFFAPAATSRQVESTSKDDLIVTTETGRVRGVRYYLPAMDKAVDAFLGIPFAKEPTGHNRFRHPQPPDSWGGIYNATRLPKACYQLTDDAFGGEFYGSNMWNPVTPISEDCLYLNVWVPKTHPRIRKSAVMVWIYGGGFYSGTVSLSLYDGKILAAENNVIVVSIAYRLGVFGFLYLNHAAAPGNAGMFDQLMGLEWVQQNIRHFGGDPDNVTLFGESAGAVSVSLHLLSPLSASKFQRAIMQSGTANMPWATLTQQEAKRRSLDLAIEALECKPSSDMAVMADCLRSMHPQQLADKQFSISSGVMQFPFLPVVDGAFLIDHPDNLLRHGDFKKCPLLMGSNQNEGSFFMIYELTEFMSLEKLEMGKTEFDRSLDILFHVYPQYNQELSRVALEAIRFQYTNWLDPDDAYENAVALDAAVGDAQFVCSLNEFGLAYARTGEEVYMYYLTQRYNTNPWPGWMGVLHGDDIFYMFGESLKSGLNFSEGDKALSRQMMHYWTNFAKTGNPNMLTGSRTLDDWPRHTPRAREYLELNSRFINSAQKSKAVGRGPRFKECAFWTKYLPALMAQTDSGPGGGGLELPVQQPSCGLNGGAPGVAPLLGRYSVGAVGALVTRLLAERLVT